MVRRCSSSSTEKQRSRAKGGCSGIGAGGFFGEMAMLDRGPRSATVTAVDDMDVLVVGQDGFNSLVDEPVVLRRMLAAESGRLRRANISASD